MSVADIWDTVARSGLVRGAVTAEDAEMVHDAGLALGLRPLEALAWQRMFVRDPYPVATPGGRPMTVRCSDTAGGAS